jgi:hypothetical protein
MNDTENLELFIVIVVFKDVGRWVIGQLGS